jgi:hypothetical protein
MEVLSESTASSVRTRKGVPPGITWEAPCGGGEKATFCAVLGVELDLEDAAAASFHSVTPEVNGRLRLPHPASSIIVMKIKQM